MLKLKKKKKISKIIKESVAEIESHNNITRDIKNK